MTYICIVTGESVDTCDGGKHKATCAGIDVDTQAPKARKGQPVLL